MAKGTGQKKSLHDLRQEIAHSRDRLARDLGGLRYELDFPLPTEPVTRINPF